MSGDEATTATELDVLEEITRGDLPSHVRASIVPEICGAQYTRGHETFPERCTREPGHARPSTLANHYHPNIGWWS